MRLSSSSISSPQFLVLVTFSGGKLIFETLETRLLAFLVYLGLPDVFGLFDVVPRSGSVRSAVSVPDSLSRSYVEVGPSVSVMTLAFSSTSKRGLKTQHRAEYGSASGGSRLRPKPPDSSAMDSSAMRR